jgi:SAM-dependent methyltransferase
LKTAEPFNLGRQNLIHRADEQWRPPRLINPHTTLEKVLSSVRRFFDLQAGSGWRDLSKMLPSVSGDVLDVGCGAQPYRPLMPSAVRYLGIDIMDSDVQFGYKAPDTIYYRGEKWPVADASMDIVLATETLEHVLRPEKFLSEAFRALRPKGRLILTVPFAARWHFVPYDYWRYTPSSLAHLLSAAHFEAIHVYGRGNAVTVACYKAMALVLSSLRPDPINTQTLFRFLVALSAVPFFFIFAIVANISLEMSSGDDCLGYTVTAVRKSSAVGEAAHV